MKKNVALVLSSGGARGIAHIGVIDELQSRGYQISSIAGTSMGALVGGMYAAESLNIFTNWILKLDKKRIFELIDFTLSRNGVIKGKRIIDEMKSMIPDRNIETLNIPFCAIATDIINNEEIFFMKGKLYDAIRASISIPSIFIPATINNMKLVDGGVLNPVPINRVKRTDGDILIVVDVNAQIHYEKTEKKEETVINTKKHVLYLNYLHERLLNHIPKNKSDKIGYFNLLNKTIGLMLHQISALTIEKYPPDILINISRYSFEVYDFYKAKELINEGKIAAKKALEEYDLKFR